jgi:small subunit ribosomal protein S9
MDTKKTTKQYIEATGRRKTSSARVRLYEGSKNSFLVNEKDIKQYFPTRELEKIVRDAIELVNSDEKYEVSIKVSGGGIHSQAEAVRHGIARALVKKDENLKTDLKKEGMLKRDGRSKERRKFGLKKARKSPQWSKR